MAHPNEDLARRAYEGFAEGDLDAVLSAFDDNIRFYVGGRSQLARAYRGKAELGGFFAHLGELTGGTFAVEVHDVLADDEHVVALVTVRAERDGRTLASQEAHVWHVREGKFVDCWPMSEDQYLVDEFWS